MTTIIGVTLMAFLLLGFMRDNKEKIMSKFLEQFNENLTRVKSLYALYDKENNKNLQGIYSTDILRACIVFLHSAFEDYFRAVLFNYMCDKEYQHLLKGVSFANLRNVEKIDLQKLAEYRAESVEDIIIMSVKEFLDKTSFNNYEQIVSWCDKIKVDLSSFNDPQKINEVIQRRHKIVHEADLTVRDAKKTLTIIQANWVQDKIEKVVFLVKIIDSQIKELYV